MDQNNCYSCGESGSGAEFVESYNIQGVHENVSGGKPDNNCAVSGNDSKTVIISDSDVETEIVSDYDHVHILTQDVVPLTPTPRCTTTEDPDSGTTTLTTTSAIMTTTVAAPAAAAEVEASMQPRECQTRSLTQLFHLTATLNEHFRLSITRMEKKLDEVVRKVSEMEEAMQEWKEGQKGNDTGEKGKEQEEKDEERRKSGSSDEEPQVRSWEKWLPRNRKVKNTIDPVGSSDESEKTEVNETNQTHDAETRNTGARGSNDIPVVTRTEKLVDDGSESDDESPSKTVEDIFRLNESEKREIKNLHDVTTQTHGIITAACDVSHPPRPVQTYHIKI